MIKNLVVRQLNREQTYRHLHVLCQNDTLFAIIGYSDTWEDKDFERIVISDQQALKAGVQGAVIGTIRLLPHDNGTALMFVNKDAIGNSKQKKKSKSTPESGEPCQNPKS